MLTSPSGNSYIGQTIRSIQTRLEEHRTGKSSERTCSTSSREFSLYFGTLVLTGLSKFLRLSVSCMRGALGGVFTCLPDTFAIPSGVISSGATSATFYKDWTNGAWTGSNTKGIDFQVSYPI